MSSVEPGTSGAEAAGEPATIVTFYSYKGGVGRTMALANVAWLMASEGFKVLVVDWDLESPGLNRFLRPFLRDPDLTKVTGVVEMVRDYGAAVEALLAQGLDQAGYEQGLAELLRVHTNVGRHADSVVWEFPVSTGRIDFLGPGRQDDNYPGAVALFEWSRFYADHAGLMFIDALRDTLLGSDYDFVLIDSRTGHSDNAGVCTLLLPDVLVAGFNLSNQSIEGTAGVARQVRAQADREIRILPVPMRVEDFDRTKALLRRSYVEQRFGALVGPLYAGMPGEYWRQVEIHHSPAFAYEEVLVPFSLDPGERSTQLQAYLQIAAEISKGRVAHFRPVPESRRQKFQRRFEELAPNGQRTARIVHAPRDRRWADWLRNELALMGIGSVTGTSAVHPAAGAEEPTYLVVVVSAALPSVPGLDRITDRYARRSRGLAGGSDDSSIVAVRVEETTLGEPFATMRGPNLKGLDEDAARAVLRSFLSPDRNGHGTADPQPGAADRGARFPGTPTAIWESPPRNSEFLGREAAVEELRNALTPGQPALPAVLWGQLGVGKSQIALEYVYRFSADYDAVWWIQADSVALIRRELALLGERLGVTSSSAPSAVQAALQALAGGTETYRRLLLVYDNARGPADLEGLVPGGGSTHVLITSEAGEWGPVGRRIEVTAPTDDEAVDQLCRRLPGMPPALASQLLLLTGRLPQTVELVTALVKATGRPYAEAVDEIRERFARLPAAAAMGYTPEARATWAISLDALRRERASAVRALELLTHLSPGGAGLPLLRSPAALAWLGRPGEPLTEQDGLTTLRALSNHALARTDFGAEQVVADTMGLVFLRDRMTAADRDESRRAAQRVLAAWSPDDAKIDSNDHAGELQELDRHVGPSDAAASTDPEVRRWLVNQVRYRRRTQQLEQAGELAETLRDKWSADAAQRQESEQQTGLRLLLAVELANIHRDAGRFRQAESVNREALEEARAALGIEHPLTLRCALGRGAELRALGQPHEAFAEDQSTLDISREVMGPTHPRTMMAASNLALSLSMLGLPSDALEVQREAFEGFEAVLGRNHDLTWYAAGHLGGHYREIGDYATSLTRLQQAYNESSTRFGQSGLTTLNAARNLAATLRRLGGPDRAGAARKLDDEALEGFLAYGGSDHHEVLASRVALAADLRMLGSAREACQEARLSLAGYERWGSDHPFLHICQANLAVCLRAAATEHIGGIRDLGGIREAGGMGEAGDAEAGAGLSEQGWRGLADTLSADNPLTLGAALGYANALVFAGESEQALAVDRGTYAGFRDRFGPDHPLTRIAAGNLQDSEARVGGIDTVTDRVEIDMEIPFI